MWGVPKLEPTLLMWMRPEISAHIMELTQIAEEAHLSLNKALARHPVEIVQIQEQHQFDLEKLALEHSKEISILKSRIHDLESRFIKDSHNSHKPPSMDGFKKPVRTQSLRQKTGRRSGGQPGHPGYFKPHSEDPHKTLLHQPQACKSCKKPLKRSSVVKTEARQVWDILDGKLQVVEHQARTKKCTRCGCINRTPFPKEVKSHVSFGPKIRSLAVYFIVKQLVPLQRTTQIFKDLYSVHLSEGTLSLILSQASKALKPAENGLKNALINSKTTHFDESGIQVNGELKWLHVATDGKNTLYSVHDKRGVLAMNDIGILPDFKGTAIHDGLKAYFTYGCKHALCNVHHLRELTFVSEFEEEPWAKEMKDFLKNANLRVRELKALKKFLTVEEINDLKTQYTVILKCAYSFHGIMNIPNLSPNETGPPIQTKKKKQKVGKNLLDRLNRYQDEVLAFLDGSVPFSNNSAEQVIRVAKVKQKISGCFRSLGGAMTFYRLRSLLGICQTSWIGNLTTQFS